MAKNGIFVMEKIENDRKCPALYLRYGRICREIVYSRSHIWSRAIWRVMRGFVRGIVRGCVILPIRNPEAQPPRSMSDV